ncbi:antitoxin VbhA family protein [Actinomyces urinae]|uniref:antitoxin VbhA family protein n=1 Tax=Actinomyces urinae TaxID=1689268 RepID=UPI0009314C4B|nr:antitoxin VbhA family protein [Actinomyces urinae]
MRTFDIEQRWPELFEGLEPSQHEIALDTLALGWHEGNAPTRRIVTNLTDYMRGEISADEYLARVTVGVLHGSEGA